MMVYKMLIVVMMFSFSSCASMGTYQSMTSGKVGCSPAEIQIKDIKSNYVMGIATWSADCKGLTYYCSSTATQDVACTEKK